MPNDPVNPALRHLRRVAVRQRDDELPDVALLEGFRRRGDAAAFEALLRRHGPMVLAVCNRILADPHDAEDAFQVTFLVLLRKADSVACAGSLAAWLHGAALRTALKARTGLAVRRRHEWQAEPMTPREPTPDVAWRELRPVLDEEVQRLPEPHRRAVVLCYLEGRTYEDAARRLGWSKGTLATRLAKARRLLQERLSARGVVLSAGLPAALALAEPAGAVPTALLAGALRTAAAAAGRAPGPVPVHLQTLCDEVVGSMANTKLKWITAVLLAAGLFGGGVGWVNSMTPADPPQPAAAAPSPEDTPEADLARLQGRWRLVSMESEGQTLTMHLLRGRTAELYRFEGDKFYQHPPGKTDEQFIARVRLDPRQRPKAIDLIAVGGADQATTRWIYDLQGDTLRLGQSGGPEQPAGFETKPGGKEAVLTLRRLKPGEPATPTPEKKFHPGSTGGPIRPGTRVKVTVFLDEQLTDFAPTTEKTPKPADVLRAVVADPTQVERDRALLAEKYDTSVYVGGRSEEGKWPPPGGRPIGSYPYVVAYLHKDLPLPPELTKDSEPMRFEPGPVTTLAEAVKLFGAPTESLVWAGRFGREYRAEGYVFWWGTVGLTAAGPDRKITHVLIRHVPGAR